MSYAGTDTDRRLGNVISIGRIKAVDPAKGLAQVDMDGPDTDWIPWATARAGGDRTYWCPEVGEQVVVAAPSGELGNAVIIGCLFQDAHPEPADSADTHRTVYADGTVVEYDRAAHAMKIDVSASSGTVTVICKTATVQASESVTIDTPETTCTGNLTVAKSLTMGGGGGSVNITGPVAINGPTLTHNGKEVGSTHTHSGVQSGGSSTGAPN
ncbi:phage baseplate assembly protein V [Microvirga sp. 17 mud 1-3]|uniref:phage baseplate assembly protein V n=1 Tax=Microvirga sp. 17 mud 1-3 TaxID=2082949 RepID=UPI000D6D0073|nr:phage baseplate assembly protein V [Microvirga sp. 17 mud 1-3]AWM87372.1 phage baseplate assembly protein V [Microvirga sp. 17 mud 1-3]